MKVRKKKSNRIEQGDIYKNISFIEYVIEKKGNIEVSKIIFPLVIVLTQDCDLEQDRVIRSGKSKSTNQDKQLLSVLVAPIYNADHVFQGEHWSEIGAEMRSIAKNKTAGTNLMNNETPRYHYIEFPGGIPIGPSIIDFKHYFSVNVEYVLKAKKSDFVCSISPLYREDISHRFASFLSRIGLPESG